MEDHQEQQATTTAAVRHRRAHGVTTMTVMTMAGAAVGDFLAPAHHAYRVVIAQSRPHPRSQPSERWKRTARRSRKSPSRGESVPEVAAAQPQATHRVHPLDPSE